MTREEVEAELRAALERLGRPAPEFCFARDSDGMASPHVEGEGPAFDWVIAERGQEYERRRVDGPELLFLALESLTCSIAQEAELRQRRGGAYSRLSWMRGHIALMRALNQDWGDRVARRYDAVLQSHPASDEEQRNTILLDLFPKR